MAIDTKAKRMSMLYAASPAVWGHLFEVDSAVDADDRAHLLHIYGGNALDLASQSLTLRIKIGSLVLVTSGVVAQPTTGANVPWKIDGEFVVRSIGATGKVAATGDHDNGQTSGLLANSGELTLDTTAENDIVVSAQWGIANASNTITAQKLEIERAE